MKGNGGVVRSSEAPPGEVVRAFGGDPESLRRLDGGQGTSWRAGDMVLKPAGPEDQHRWLAGVLAEIPDSAAFRLARPVASAAGEYVVQGWAATRWLPGHHVSGRWHEKLAVSAALHSALAAAPEPPFRGDDPWSIAARVAWGEPAPPGVDIALPVCEPWTGAAPQLIHGDLAGNILFADNLPPAVIDMSPHWAPAPFADAVMVADAVAWSGASVHLAQWFADTVPGGRELLARAVIFRVVTIALLCPDDPARIAAEEAGYAPVSDIT